MRCRPKRTRASTRRTPPQLRSPPTQQRSKGRSGSRARPELPPCRCNASRRYHRSEEHTSELQSPCNLVCRLLLEKKKNTSHNLPGARHSRTTSKPVKRTSNYPFPAVSPPHPLRDARLSR